MADNPNTHGQYFGYYTPSTPLFGPSTAKQSQQSHPSPFADMPSMPHTTSQSTGAYEYNSSRIPGLGLGGAPNASTTGSTVPSFPSGVGFPPWFVAAPISQANPTNTQFASQQLPVTLPQQPSASYQQAHSNTLEEGELSEGEFEDLYEPGACAGASQELFESEPTQSNKLDGHIISVGDVDESSIYDPNDPHIGRDESPAEAIPTNSQSPEQEYSPDDEWEPLYPERDRSGSYSPYLSPREVHRKIPIAKTASRDVKVADPVEPSQSTHQTGLCGRIPERASSNNDVSPSRSTPEPKKTVQDVKKKAQEAILGLWPLKVRYQDYLDEGLDANIVQRLFKELGLDVPSPKTTTAPVKATVVPQSTLANAVSSSNAPLELGSPPPQTPHAPLLESKQDDIPTEKDMHAEVKAPAKSAAEERKDKIARKLAAIAQKSTTSQPSASITSAPTEGPASVLPVVVSAAKPVDAPLSRISGPSPAPTPASTRIEAAVPTGSRPNVVNTPPTAAKTRAENTAILQQKLAALKKQQAQLAADKARTISSEGTATSSPGVANLSLPDTSSNGDSIIKSKSTASAPPNLNQKPSAELRGNTKGGENIPGLLFPSLALQPPQGPSRGVKRPVASDFDNYASHFEQPKRSRVEETLIIDVTDDEDVEMDMGSPTEELSPLLEPSTASSLQALPTFPPLSDGPNGRQQASPASSSAPTPPINGARIDILHKRIEETKRLIAEAEAKKAAKKATIHSLPKPMSRSIERVNTSGSVDKEDSRAIHERRDRIVGYELPRVNATLKQKQDKLKSIIAEAEQLQLEVKEALDERQKLTVEMECLVESSSISLEVNEHSPLHEADMHPNLAPSQSAPLVTDHSHTRESYTPFASQPDLQDQYFTDQPSEHKKMHSTSVDEDMEEELSNDEALQAAILTDNNHSMDMDMTDADIPDPAVDIDHLPVTQNAPNPDVTPPSLENTDPAQPITPEMEINTEQTAEIIPADVTAEAQSAGPALSDTSISPSEPDVNLPESDVAVHESAPELSQSDDESYEPRPAQISEFHSAQIDEQDSTEAVDDIVEELNPNHIATERSHPRPEHTTNEDNQGNIPALGDLLSYKSPLSYFRAYRFHPKYFEDVPGGLKSMTFSAKIDPMRELCPHVLGGEESCPDGPNCEYQHFDSMILAEAEIITQLGSADMFAGETKTKFIEGLKKVLNELKTNRIKDFDRITKAIVKHRQEFLGDQTKVLALDSTPHR
ncbi:hypothetical protein GGR50DRAFT_650954 [Xylaria sp. CBS 124048]|nr:hypothetical protein GGR50DRAFT_650954 [Xylaria sp. CBS 124048]